MSRRAEAGSLEKTRLGGYELDALAGRSSAGEVYKARDLTTSRLVALRVLPAELCAAEGFAARFEAFGARVCGLEDPHWVPTLACVHVEDRFLIASAWSTGTPLDSALRNVLPLAPGVRCLAHVAAALVFAHGQGLTHGWLRPRAVMITGMRTQLRGLGLAALLGRPPAGPPQPAGARAPEQAPNALPTPAADLFALGGLLYHLLTGSALPDDSTGRLGALERVAAGRLGAVDVGAEPLVTLLQQLLSSAPEARLVADSARLVLEVLGQRLSIEQTELHGLPGPLPSAPPRPRPGPAAVPGNLGAPATLVQLDGPMAPQRPEVSVSQALAAEPQALGQLGKFLLVEPLGEGTHGVVFTARQLDAKRDVALKLLKPEGPEAAERFMREARAAARLRHEHIASIHEVGEYNGQYYVAMDLIDGQTLAHIIPEDGMPVRRALTLVRDSARALAYAHGEGVVHRDLRPSNILLNDDESPRITDFGLAGHVSAEAAEDEAPAISLAYRSPEQLRGSEDAVDGRSDLFSLGAILYQMLTGRPAFDEGTSARTATAILEQDPVPPRSLNAQVHPDAQTICLKALEKLPAGRYQTATELADDIDRFLQGQPIEAVPVKLPARVLRQVWRSPRALAVIGVLLVLGLGWWGTLLFMERADDQRELRRLHNEAAHAFRKGRFEHAATLFRVISERDPDDELARNGAADAERELGWLKTQLKRLVGKSPAERETIWTVIIARVPMRAEFYSRRGLCRVERVTPRLAEPPGDFQSALSLQEREPWAQLGLGMYHELHRGDLVQAIEAYERAVSYCEGENPPKARARRRAADCAQRLRLIETARKALAVTRDPVARVALWRQLADAAPLSVEAHAELAIALMGQPGSDAAAIKAALDRALALDPDHPATQFANALHLDRTAPSDALSQYVAAARRAGPERRRRALLRAAQIYREQGKPGRGLELLEPLRAASKDPAVHTEVGNALRAVGKAPLALTAYARALELDTRFLEARLARAALWLVEGEGPKALGELRQAVEDHPRSARAHRELGLLLRSLDQPAQAVKAFDEAITLAPDDLISHRARLALWIDAGRTAEAAGELARLVVAHPEDLALRVLQGWVHRLAGELKAARAALEIVLGKDRMHQAALAELARVHLARGKPTEALPLVMRLWEQRQDDPGVKLQVADVYAAIGGDDLYQARGFYEQVTRVGGRHAPAAWLGLGEVYRHMNNMLGKSEEAFGEALRLGAKAGYYGRALTRLARRNVPGAKADLRQAIKLDPDPRRREAARKRLAQLGG